MPKAAVARKPAKVEPYDVHPSMRMLQGWITSLPVKTGRSLDQWLTHIREHAPAGEAERRDWLKREHGMGTNTAWWIAERSCGKGSEEDTPEGYLRQAAGYVEAMYAPRPGLRQIHDALIAAARSLGKDVKVCPCKTIVPLFREHVFAQIKPATKSRLDLGLALGAMMKQGKAKFPGRLIDTGGFEKKDRITHRIALASVDEIDSEVRTWLKKAYDLAAP